MLLSNFFRTFEEHLDEANSKGVYKLVELPQGVIIEVRRGGHDALAKLSGDMVRLNISGYIRVERRPKEIIPRVSQVVIQDGAPKIALHESDVFLGGLEALLEIERDAMALDALVSLVEIPDEDLIRIINLYPDSVIESESSKTEGSRDDWWNYVKLNSSGWRREQRLPEQEIAIEAPEYIRQLTKAKLQKIAGKDKSLNYGDVILQDSGSAKDIHELGGILAAFGRPTLVISREQSRDLLNHYSIPEQSCLELSTSKGDGFLTPELESVSQKINDFLWSNRQAVVVFSGIEYLLSINDFNSTVKLFRDLVDQIRNGDHLMLVACDLDIFEITERHLFAKEFTLLPATFFEMLILDPESINEHPICTELTDEELSWIQQQLSFIEHGSSESAMADGELVGGASNLIDEDVVEVGDKLAQLVGEWDSGDIASETQKEISTIPTVIANPVEEKFDQVFAESVTQVLEVPAEASTDDLELEESIEENKSPVVEPVVKPAGPRRAIRVKRTKKRKARTTSKRERSKISIAAAVQSNVIIPEIESLVRKTPNRQAINVDLVKRSERIDSALDNMLTKSSISESRDISQALRQKSSRSIHTMPSIDSKPEIALTRRGKPSGKVHPSSEIEAPQSSGRKSRESATRTQQNLDIDQNYTKWATEYKASLNDSLEASKDAGGDE